MRSWFRTVGLGVLLGLALLGGPLLWRLLYPPAPPPPPPKPQPVEILPEDGDAAFRYIVQQQQKNLAQIRTLNLSFNVSRQTLAPGHESANNYEFHIIRSGNSGWSEMRNAYANPRTNESQYTVTRNVWNDRCLVHWPATGPAAYMWEYPTQDTMPADARIHKASSSTYPERRYAYGCGTHALDELAANRVEHFTVSPQAVRFQPSPFKFKVSRVESDKGLNYRIEGWMKPGSYRYPAVTLTVDPSKGYMVTYAVRQSLESGEVWEEFWVVPREVAPGVWYPVAWEQRAYGSPDPVSGAKALRHHEKCKVTGIDVNPAIPDSQFTWSALGLRTTTEILRWDAAGGGGMMHLVNGQLVTKRFGAPVPDIHKGTPQEDAAQSDVADERG